MSRQVPVLVDARAEQPLQRLGSSGYGDKRLVWRDLGGVRKPLSVAVNLDQLVCPLVGRQIEVRLRRAPGHAEALLREMVDPGGATTTGRPTYGWCMPSRPTAGRH
jgi:hypothetical protein